MLMTQNKRLVGILAGALSLLLIPLVAMQFTSQVNWTGFDFLVMGVLLAGTGLLIELVLRKVRTTHARIMLVAAVFLVFVLVWAELAVGIFGTAFAGS